MIFSPTEVKGAFIIDLEKREDERGFFARAFCQREFEQHGLTSHMVQCNLSFNHKKGTLRGMHYQAAPHGETKLVRCIRGEIYDVIIDLRADSPTAMKWVGVELSAENHRMLYVPGGCAHGFQTLTDNSEVFYLVSEFYTPAAERGARWNDHAFNIRWPEVAQRTVSPKDASWPDFQPAGSIAQATQGRSSR
jgi:dTDP-4-dehydrorhamnose 3,5-epimerase